MTARLHFELPQTLIINANQREHHMAKANRIKNLRQMAALVAKNEQARVGSDCASLLIEIGWPDKRRRDVENLAPTIKALTDGCIDAGLLPDDDDKHIVERTWRARVGTKPGITVIDMTFFPRLAEEVAP